METVYRNYYDREGQLFHKQLLQREFIGDLNDEELEMIQRVFCFKIISEKTE